MLASDAEELAGEYAGFGLGLGGLGGVALGAFRGLEDEGAGFGVEGFEVGEVAVEFAVVAADERFTFAAL